MKLSSKALPVVLCSIVLMTLWSFWKFSYEPSMALLRRDINDLNAKWESCNQTLQLINTRLQESTGVAANSTEGGGTSSSLSVQDQLAELLRTQSNTTAFLQRFVGTVMPDPVEAANRAQEAIQSLEQSVSEQEQELARLEESVTSFVSELSVPTEVAELDGEPQDAPDLRKYAPYFNARRQRNVARRMLENLQLRLLQERVDAAVPR